MASMNGRSASEIFQGQAVLYRHLLAFKDSMCLKWIVQLGIPNIIHKHGQPITLSELLSKLQVPPTKLGHVQSLMRYLAHNGFFERVRIHVNGEESEAYALTVVSELLVKGSELCLAPMVECILDPNMVDPYHQLNKWVYEEGRTLFDVSKGSHFWEYLAKNPAYNESFNDAMASDSRMANLALRDCKLVFEGLESIVDVGGGTGITAKIISEEFPNLKCIVFDRPQVVENLSGSKNLTYVGGDMFISIPKADAILLKATLHNWTDKDCIKILENCKDAISSDGNKGKVIIIDTVVNEKQDEHEDTTLKLLMDVTMATSQGGKERSEEEWKKLFLEAGFRDYKISPYTRLFSLIELFP